MSEFSLIVPVYDTARYLSECLDSCLNQTFRDMEIICVNDCSPDNSAEILANYARKDPRVKVITHEKNLGLGGARNSAVAAASGEYCWFIDSDDFILLESCEMLHHVLQKNKADIIRFNYANFRHDPERRLGAIEDVIKYSWQYERLYTRKDFCLLPSIQFSPCTFICRTALLRTVAFREHVIHEDNDFTPILFSRADSIYYINFTLYLRRLHSNSITSDETGASLPRHIVAVLYAINRLADYILQARLPARHFCVRTLRERLDYAKEAYKRLPEIQNREMDAVIKKAAKVVKKCYDGDMNIYNEIVAAYGNTRLLEFILKSYRFIVKRVRAILIAVKGKS